jgi:hypothetical protein
MVSAFFKHIIGKLLKTCVKFFAQVIIHKGGFIYG